MPAKRRRIYVDELIDAIELARILGLAHSRQVHDRSTYPDMPEPVIDLGRGRAKLWVRPTLNGGKTSD